MLMIERLTRCWICFQRITECWNALLHVSKKHTAGRYRCSYGEIQFFPFNVSSYICKVHSERDLELTFVWIMFYMILSDRLWEKWGRLGEEHKVFCGWLEWNSRNHIAMVTLWNWKRSSSAGKISIWPLLLFIFFSLLICSNFSYTFAVWYLERTRNTHYRVQSLGRWWGKDGIGFRNWSACEYTYLCSDSERIPKCETWSLLC